MTMGSVASVVIRHQEAAQLPWTAGGRGAGPAGPVYWQVRLYREPTHLNFQHYMLVSNPFVLVIQVTSALVVGGYLR